MSLLQESTSELYSSAVVLNQTKGTFSFLTRVFEKSIDSLIVAYSTKLDLICSNRTFLVIFVFILRFIKPKIEHEVTWFDLHNVK